METLSIIPDKRCNIDTNKYIIHDLLRVFYECSNISVN